MKVAFWDIYNAQLFAKDGKYIPGQPFALEIEYLRSIKKSRLINETINQWKHIGLRNHPSAQDWAEQLEQTWSDVRASDTLTMIVTENQHATFLLNGTTLGTIKDPEFSIAFSSIWLSIKTSRPELRKQLLGAN
ncbi:MAG: chalcone isomerase family protein [Agarilytica sp.]